MFLSPFFMIAAAVAASIPLLLHLLQTRKRVATPFPTLRFLRVAQKQSSRRIRLENFLLWLIRTLIILMLGAAFAMPILRQRGLTWLGDAPRDVALVIDVSYSMGYQTGRDTVWDKAVESARAILAGLGENDRFCIYLARDQAEPLVAEPVNDKKQGLDLLGKLQPGNTSSQLAPAALAAMRALRKNEQGREMELHIITDKQALPWESFGGGDGVSAAWDPSVLDDHTGVFVTLLGVPAPENTGPVDIDLQPAVIRPGTHARVATSFVRTGSAPPTTATLFIDDKQVARLPVGGGRHAPSTPTFPLPPMSAGVHAGRIESPHDNLPADDAFHFLIRVEEPLPSLCVGGLPDTLFVRTALKASAGKNAPPPALMSPDSFVGAGLSRYACVFLCNALPVSGQAMRALEDYVRDGGMLVIFPGMNGNAAAYKAWSCLPGIPTDIEDIPASLRRCSLTWELPRHPIIRALRQGNEMPPLTVRRSLIWKKRPPDTRTLVSMGPAWPFLLERPFGAGRVLMFAVSADRTWSDFPLSPFYLPMLAQCVDFGSGLGTRAPYQWVTQSLPLTGLASGDPRDITLLAPDGKAVRLRKSLEGGRTTLVADGLTTPGIYELSTPTRNTPTRVLAVNLPRRESDLTPIPADTLAERLGTENIYIADHLAALQQMIKDHRIGRSYGEHLLWLALVLIALEFFLSNFLAHRQSLSTAAASSSRSPS